jgi:hypothetical protein
MRSKASTFAELCILILGGAYMCYCGSLRISELDFAIIGAPTRIAYIVGRFVGMILGTAFPVIIGLGLFVIAYSRTRVSKQQRGQAATKGSTATKGSE